MGTYLLSDRTDSKELLHPLFSLVFIKIKTFHRWPEFETQANVFLHPLPFVGTQMAASNK
jgi:hypothetical protein